MQKPRREIDSHRSLKIALSSAAAYAQRSGERSEEGDEELEQCFPIFFCHLFSSVFSLGISVFSLGILASRLGFSASRG